MGCTVSELMARMDSREFARWIAYTRVEPIGDDRADVQAAMIATAISRAMGAEVKLTDYLPDYWRDREADAQARDRALLARIRAFGREHNAAVEARERGS